MKTSHLKLRVFISLMLSFCAGCFAAEPLNFVFLLVDDLGWGDFGCYGSEFYETPNIDRLAAQGMQFSNAYAACTVCSPSRAAIMTGCYPGRTHLTDWIAGHKRPYAKLTIPDWQMYMDFERTVLPEALKESGYETAIFGKWHLMPHESPNWEEHDPTAHGFDLNVGGREWGMPKGPGKYFSPFDMPNLDDGKPGDFLTDKLTDAAIDYLDRTTREKPFFLYFSYYTVHWPVMCPPELEAKYTAKAEGFENKRNEYLNAKRAGMIEKLDDSVGRVMAKLEEMGIADHTVVFLTGDNGCVYNQANGGLRDGKGYAHEGGVREPLLVRWPGKIAQGSSCDFPVIGTDFYPTMLEMAGLALRPAEHKDGISILPLLTGESAALPRTALYWHYPHYHKTNPYGAVRDGDMKLIEFFEDGRLELYNLKDDPFETKNLAQKNPEKAQELLMQLRAWRKSVDAQMPTENPAYDSEKDQSSQIKKPKKDAK